ncbi:MAG: BREX-1 system adenine-specific DNA-methyltransferase PglX [Caloramator sp.]|nr:BREX-1 system adenine-specific DNA-methyltransferase PglX [Caloramator sp.]
MNKNALKKLAVTGRQELIEKIKNKAFQYGIQEDEIKKSQIISSDSIIINGRPLSPIEKTQRQKLIDKIKYLNEQGQEGYNLIIEEVAYTWFNRFIALRFMEVNNYLPTKVRALSSSGTDSFESDLLKYAFDVKLPVDKEKIYDMKMKNDLDGLFKYMIISQCNSLNKSLPFMFEKIGDYTELLFPDNLLNEGAFIRRLTDTSIIPESDWKDVEVIGWLYQFYISEEKDRVFSQNSKHKKEEIPYATQLFTPGWIVRYMVQNSLGRYWIESHKEHTDLKNEWEYYLESLCDDKDYEEKLAPHINRELNIEDIKCFDPACGSGHILVYMFDVLYKIYEKCGYVQRDIPKLIIENNLYGLEIDDRAYQLACFSVVMRGMKYNDSLLRTIEREGININIASIQETNNLNEEDIVYIAGENFGSNYEKTKEFIKKFKDAKIYGSLIKIDEFDKEFFEKRLENIINNPAKDLIKDNIRKKIIEILPNLIKQSEIMSRKYDILVTNPPYIGLKKMNVELSEYLKKNFPDSKIDTCTAFMEIDNFYLKEYGFMAMINQHSWMFLSSFENLRDKIILNRTIYSMLHLGAGAFEEINGEVVQSTAFVLRKIRDLNLKGEYIRLIEIRDSEEKKIKTKEAVDNPKVSYRYRVDSKNFKDIPGMPIAYWVKKNIMNIFKNNKLLNELYETKKGMFTGDNEYFLRIWYEIKNTDIGKNFKFYNKGGGYRKWYGNNDIVIKWHNNGYEIKNFKKSGNIYENYFFTKCLTWNLVSTSDFCCRALGDNFVIGDAGPICLVDNDNYFYLLGYMNTNVCNFFMKILNPTLNYPSGIVGKLPIEIDNYFKTKINKIVEENIEISKTDWDSYETSWDFKRHPLLVHKKDAKTIEEAYKNWEAFAKEQFHKLKENEEKLNEIFIEIYGLKGELMPEVDENDVTVRKAELERDIKSFISYAVGCMFGRYSLDEEGLIYAGGDFDINRYKKFKPCEDNIIPILEDEYFEGDIVSRFTEFLEITFGRETLTENLSFIAKVLGKKEGETSKDTIRRYFLNDFYKDHTQTYKKRPIYWLFTSGKQKSLNCLVYIHRYDKATLSNIRNNYLHQLQDKLEIQIKLLKGIAEGEYSTKEKNTANKKIQNIEKQMDELKKYDSLLRHMADIKKVTDLDLDDGVIRNYEKLKDLLALIK